MSYTGFKNVLVDVTDHIATVTLNRPDTRNACTMDVHEELIDIWHKIGRDENIRAVVFTGAGKAFSAGGDITKMKERFGTPLNVQHCLRTPGHTRRMWEALFTVEQPVICAINGDAMGLGCSLALFCDITVIADDARIGDTHTRMGMVAGDGGAVVFPVLLGLAKARDFLMRSKVVLGKEAAEIGLCNYSVPREEVLAEATKIAAELAEMPGWAIRWTKLAVNKALRHQFNLAFDVAMPYEMMSMQHDDFGEAANAFLDKRKPVFNQE